MRFRLVIPVLLALVAGAACGDEPNTPQEPAIPSMAGAWTGSTGGITVNLTLSEGSGGAVSGSGNISDDEESAAVTVTGTHTHPSVALTMQSTGFEDMNFSGSFSGDDSIPGSLNGSGFQNFAITLRRQ